MELGVALYYLIVFGLGGLLLLALVIYFVREFFINKKPWTQRSKGSKVTLILATVLGAVLLYVPTHMVWVTRLAVIPGKYKSEGVWGTATIELLSDGRFIETWQFKNEYNGKAEGSGSQQGMWRDSHRDWLTREISLEHFIPLAEWDRNSSFSNITAYVEGYSGRTAINVDRGADIYFFKEKNN